MARRLAPLLALLLLLQWSAALGHCRALRAAPLLGPSLCLSHGSDAPTPGKPMAAADWDCPACHQLPMLDDAAPPRAAARGLAWTEQASPPALRAGPALGPRAPPPPARAPPTA